MKNSRGVSLIALIITIIVIIILAAIVMNASPDTVGNAQYARFAQEFGEYSDQVMLDSANVKSQTGIRGQIINGAQQYYMTANGMSNIEPGSGDAQGADVGLNKVQGVAGYTMPVGYVVTNYNSADKTHQYVLQTILNIGNGADTTTNKHGVSITSGDDQVAYVINDGVITNYVRYGNNLDNGSASHEFYGDSNGEEYHFITSMGDVFTLPGYPVQQSDGSIEYHIDSKNGHYYVVAGNSGKEPSEADNVTNINGDQITNKQPILAHYLWETKGINARTGARLGSEGFGKGTENSNKDMADQAWKVYKPGTDTAKQSTLRTKNA
jgi:type II secretory pathway pseudopilin PulG